MNRSEIVATARGYVGTPYVHQGRIPGVGLDCVGVLVCLARSMGLVSADFDRTGYTRRADGVSLLRELRAVLVPVQQDSMQAGDVVCVAFDRDPQHVGILGDYRHGGLSIIHAVGRRGAGVIETRLMFSSGMRFVAAFSFPGAGAWPN